MTRTTTQAGRPDEAKRQQETEELQRHMARIGRKLLVLSGKGGVGKSTVAVNLATSLARAGRKVGLLDVDLHGPSIPTLLGLQSERLEPNPAKGIVPIQVNENLAVISVGLLLGGADDAVIWRGPMKYNVIRQLLKDVAWGDLDDLVIDSPPGTGDEPLAVAQMVGQGALAIVVTTPQDVAIADVRRGVSFCNTLGLEIAGIVENMSGLLCPHCGGQVELFKTGGGEALAAEAGVPFLGRIPLDPEIAAAGDNGTPLTQADADSPAAQAFASVIAPLLAGEPEQSPHTLTRSSKETKPMKIAIPIAEGKLAMHFGHCQQFALIEIAADGKTIAGTSYETPPPHEPGVLPRWLHEQGANIIIAGGMGQRAQGLFAENDIKVIVGAPGDTPESIVLAYLADTLEVGGNVCDH